MVKSFLFLCGLGLAAAAAGADLPFRTGTVFGRAVRFAEQADAVVLDGGRLYVGGSGHLSVYDVAGDARVPKLLGATKEIAAVRQFAVQDGFAYAVARANGLWIVDCRDPRAPRTVGHLPSTSNCTGVDVAGGVCFIGGSRSGLDFVDVRDPAHPRLIANRKVQPVESQSVAYRDGYLYSGEWNPKCVTVWDCRDLADIRRVALAPLASNGDGVWPQGRWLYANTGWNTADKRKGAPARPGQMGLEVFDIADPTSPRKVGRVDFAYCAPKGLDMWLARSSGDRVFCAQNRGGLYAVDVSDKSAPKVLDRWAFLKAKGPARAKSLAAGHASECVASVAVGDGVVYVAGPGLGAWAVPAQGAKLETVAKGRAPLNPQLRPSRPSAPEGFARWLPADDSLAAEVTGVAVRGDFCFAACGTAGLYVLALSADGFREVARLPLAECMDVSVAGDRLFVAAGREGFLGYEIGPDGALKEFLRHPSLGARDVYALGDGRTWAGFNTDVFDVSDPARPRRLVGLVHQARWNRFLCPDLLGGRWAIGNTALRHLGWADLRAPAVVETEVRGYVPKTGGVCALGDRALLVDGGKWALLAPGSTEPPELKLFPAGGGASGIPRADGTTVAICAGKAVGVWDFADASAPRRLANFAVPAGLETVAFWRRHLVVPGLAAGVLLSSKPIPHNQ